MKAIFKIGAPIIALTGGIIGLAATNNANDNGSPVRYEVIHNENGVTIVHDTTIADGSTYTVQNYLADLGLNNSENLEIIKLDEILGGMETFVFDAGHSHFGSDTEIEVEKRIVISHIDEHTTQNDSDEPVIEKKEIKIEMEGEFDIEALKQQLKDQGLDDAMIKTITESMEGLPAHDGSSEEHIEMKMVFSDDSTHTMDMDDIDGHVVYEKDEPNRKVKVAMIGDLNSTLVVVSNLNEIQTKQAKIETTQMDVRFFPNPAQESFTLSFENKKAMKTSINIVDLKGKEVFSKDFGKVNGKLKEQVETSNWTPGVYLINVKTDKDITSKKLVIK